MTRHRVEVHEPPTPKGTLMALINFIETEYGRVEFAPEAAGIEYRCDKCERYMAPELIVDLHVTTADADGVVGAAQAQVHKECASGMAAQLAERTVEAFTA